MGDRKKQIEEGGGEEDGRGREEKGKVKGKRQRLSHARFARDAECAEKGYE